MNIIVVSFVRADDYITVPFKRRKNLPYTTVKHFKEGNAVEIK
jgi:hypothetical protein